MLEAHPRPRTGGLLAGRLRALPLRGAVSVAVAPRVALLVWCGVLVLAAILVAVEHVLLPARFFYDAAHIASIARHGLAAGQGDQSFIAVGEFYNILRLQNSPQLTALVSFLALAGVHTVVLRRLLERGRVPVVGLVLLTVSLGIGSVYLTSYSKDVVVLLLMTCVLFAPTRWWGEAIILAALLAYAACFRSYWVLVVLGYVAIRLVDRLQRRAWIGLLVPFAVLLVVAATYSALTGGAIDQARMLANSIRLGSPDASTMINDYIALPQPWGSMLNSCLNLVLLVVPVPLLGKGSAYYTAIAVALLALWVCVGVAWLRRPNRGAIGSTRTLALLLAFVTTQAIFEPDYGSALRHLSPLLPLLALGVGLVASSREDGRAGAVRPVLRRGRHAA